jgi:hypothetical protein
MLSTYILEKNCSNLSFLFYPVICNTYLGLTHYYPHPHPWWRMDTGNKWRGIGTRQERQGRREGWLRGGWGKAPSGSQNT